MSVLIKGMEMPTSCRACHLKMNCDDCEGFECVCVPLHQQIGYLDDLLTDKRRDDCPLVPVTPHGDLIDRNKLYEKTAEWEAQALHMVEVTMNDEDTTEWRKWSTVLTERSAFKFDVADAPTIIPASDKEAKE